MFETRDDLNRILSLPGLPSPKPDHTHTHSPSRTARGRRHSGRTHNTDELLRLLFKDTLPPSNCQPSLPAPPDMCELLQKSREWLVTADCLWYQRVDTETALKHRCYGGGSNFSSKMEQYLKILLQGMFVLHFTFHLTVLTWGGVKVTSRGRGGVYILLKYNMGHGCAEKEKNMYDLFLHIYVLGIRLISKHF